MLFTREIFIFILLLSQVPDMTEIPLKETKSAGFTKKYKKRLLLRCIHHYKSDLINNMDQMRSSGTEPSSVILSQTK